MGRGRQNCKLQQNKTVVTSGTGGITVTSGTGGITQLQFLYLLFNCSLTST